MRHFFEHATRPAVRRLLLAIRPKFSTPSRPMSRTIRAAMGTTLTMPVLAIGGEKSFGANQAVVMRHAATQVTEVVIPSAGHWLMEEEPAATMTAIRTFLDAKNVKVEP